jgi:predicted DNA-binding protein
MPKKNPESTVLSADNIPPALRRLVDKLCEMTGESQSTIIRESLRSYVPEQIEKLQVAQGVLPQPPAKVRTFTKSQA